MSEHLVLKKTNSALHDEIDDRKTIAKKLERLASMDPLTKLWNRRKLDELFDFKIKKNKRYQTGMSLIICDIDHFKKTNDTYGYDIGDEVLAEFARKLKEQFRETDIVARWG